MIIRPTRYGVDFYGDLIFTSEDELQKHSERVRNFREASLKGWSYAMQHPEEIIDLILAEYSTRKSREHLRFEANAMHSLILPDLVEIGHTNPGRWEATAKTFARYKIIEPDYTLDGFIYTPKPEGEFKFPWQVVGIAGGLFGIISLSVVFLLFLNHRLHREIDERKQAVKALHSSEREKTAVLNAMTEIVTYLDRNQKIIWANHAAAQRMGTSVAELVGRSCHDLWHHPDDLCIQCPVSKAIDNGETQEKEIISNDGRSWLARAYPVKDDKGELVGIVCLVEDITQKQKQEGEVLRTKKLESIGVLAGGIAHDFNNMLTAVMGYITLAQMKIEPKSKTSEFLNDAEKAAMKARDLAQKLLTFSKGGEPVKKKAQIRKSLIHSIDLVLSGSTIHHELDCPEELFPVEFDQTQMEEAFRNILINAIDAMPNGGHIAVKAENIYIGKESLLNQRKGNYIKVSFRDNGTGIPGELLEKIFDPYFSTKEMGAQKGMGLGLSITHSIIKKHHGFITVKSDLGKGTTFYIFLPASVQHTQVIEPKFPITPAGDDHKGKILVMDDEEMIWDVAAQMLTHLGYETAYAMDGNEAIKAYKQARANGIPFDAVILDLTIKGGLGGKDTIAKLLEIDPNVKAFVSSGYSDDPVVTGYKAYGFIGVIVKPYNINDLSEALVVLQSE
jgi:PAS domain S-box-containing protein